MLLLAGLAGIPIVTLFTVRATARRRELVKFRFLAIAKAAVVSALKVRSGDFGGIARVLRTDFGERSGGRLRISVLPVGDIGDVSRVAEETEHHAPVAHSEPPLI